MSLYIVDISVFDKIDRMLLTTSVHHQKLWLIRSVCSDWDGSWFSIGRYCRVRQRCNCHFLSIYDQNVTILAEPATKSIVSAVLALPNIGYSFSMDFPPNYPDELPWVAGTHHVAVLVKKGEGISAAIVLRDVLDRLSVPGRACLFD